MKKGVVMLMLAFSIGYAQQLPFVGVKYFRFCSESECGTAGGEEITISKNGLVKIGNAQTHYQISNGIPQDIYYKGSFSNPLFIGEGNSNCEGDTYVFKKNKIFCTYGGIIRRDSRAAELD